MLDPNHPEHAGMNEWAGILGTRIARVGKSFRSAKANGPIAFW